MNGTYKKLDTRDLKSYGEPFSDIDAVTCPIFEEDVEELLSFSNDEEVCLWEEIDQSRKPKR